ncbi:MAG: hypothetical protein LBB35_00050 [Coriobacteriaceae bacterium]|jgi:hypothetical protein|nr:hypothetical protein [Coriobacteriaceae bacterium]
MKIADASKGFVSCFLLNMLFNFEWGLLALVFYLLHLWFRIPLWIALAFLGVWVALPLTIAILVVVNAIRPSKQKPKMDERHTAPIKAQAKPHSFGSATTAFLNQQSAAVPPADCVTEITETPPVRFQEDTHQQ